LCGVGGVGFVHTTTVRLPSRTKRLFSKAGFGFISKPRSARIPTSAITSFQTSAFSQPAGNPLTASMTASASSSKATPSSKIASMRMYDFLTCLLIFS
jgi:hypothetical protein